MVHSVCGIPALVDLGKVQATSMMDQVAVKTQTVGMTWLKMARFCDGSDCWKVSGSSEGPSYWEGPGSEWTRLLGSAR